MLLKDLRRGLLAGVCAGLFAGLFAFFIGEPLLDRAIALEEHTGHGAHEVFSRGEQKGGLVLAATLYGVAVGIIFGAVSALIGHRAPVRGPLRRSLTLAGTAFLGVALMPFAKYPPNPPGIGADPATLTERTIVYLAMMLLSLFSIFAAWWFARGLSQRTGVRVLAAGAVILSAFTLLYVGLPSYPVAGTGEAPPGLLWSFRLSSLGTQAVLWLGIGLLFGLLGRRAETRPGEKAETVEAAR